MKESVSTKAFRHVLVVGGTKGIGRAIAGHFLNCGVKVVSLIGRSVPDTSAGLLLGANFVNVDLNNFVKLEEAMSALVREKGRFSEIVFSQRYRGDCEDWPAMAQVSWKAVSWFLNSPQNWMHEEGGSVVMLSSPAAHQVVVEQPLSYHVAKAGLDQLVRYYAVQLGPKGIRVNGVSPAIVIKEESKSYFEGRSSFIRALESAMPLRKIPTTQDVADVVHFLCSPSANSITGQIFTLDGGLGLRAPVSIVGENVL